MRMAFRQRRYVCRYDDAPRHKISMPLRVDMFMLRFDMLFFFCAFDF